MALATLRSRIMIVLRRHALVTFAYLVIAVLFVYPAVLHLDNAIVGYGWDGLLSYWNLWWTRQALAAGENPYHTSMMYHPAGLSLYFHTYNVFTSVLSLPLQMCCGLAAAYNMTVTLTFALAALGMYALARYITGHRGAAFVAGLIYGFCPYMVLHVDVAQPHLIATQWLPCYLLALLIGLRERRVFLWLAALFLVLNGLSEWHYTIYALLLTGVIGIYEVIRLHTWRDLTAVSAKIAFVGLLFALMFAPVLVPMLQEVLQSPYAARSLRHSIYHSTDLLAFLLPSIYHPLWGEWASAVFHEYLVRWYIVGGVATLGYTPIVLALCGLLALRQRGGLFVAIFLTFFLLALGPYLQVNGHNSYDAGQPIPLPYLLFYQLPLMSFQRVPSRFVVGVMLALAVLAAVGIQWLWERPAIAALPAWAQQGMLLLLALLVLFEFWPRPFSAMSVGPERVSSFYQQLGTTTGGALLELPHLDNYSLFYQTYHQRPTVGGKISRHKGHPWGRARFFGPLLRLNSSSLQDVGQDDSASAARSALSCQRVEYIVVYKQDVPPEYTEMIQKLEQRLFADITPVHEDAMLRAYAVSNEHPDQPYWTLDQNEWYPPDTNEQGIRYRWTMGNRGSMLIYPCGQTQALVRFNIFSLDQPRTLHMSLNGEPFGSFQVPQASVRRIWLQIPLEAGENRLELRSDEPAVAPAAYGFENDERLIGFNVSQVLVTGD